MLDSRNMKKYKGLIIFVSLIALSQIYLMGWFTKDQFLKCKIFLQYDNKNITYYHFDIKLNKPANAIIYSNNKELKFVIDETNKKITFVQDFDDSGDFNDWFYVMGFELDRNSLEIIKIIPWMKLSSSKDEYKYKPVLDDSGDCKLLDKKI